MPIKINHEKCCWKDGQCTNCSCEGSCVGCVEVCPSQALSRKKILEFDESKCLNCGACINACKHGALTSA